MMPNHLPPQSVETILAAAGRTKPHDPALIDALGRWLDDGLERAIDRARAKPLTQGDVNKLDRAYVRFRDTVQALQDRKNPPPSIPARGGETDWDCWVATHRAFGFKRGRRESVDWYLIGELIALYEVISKRRASASQSRGPTMRFLGTALSELANHAPSETRSYFATPKNGALKEQLGVLRKGYFRFLGQELSILVEITEGR